jgi:hypothetical protein
VCVRERKRERKRERERERDVANTIAAWTHPSLPLPPSAAVLPCSLLRQYCGGRGPPVQTEECVTVNAGTASAGRILSHTPAYPPPPTGRSPCRTTTQHRHLHASTVTPIAAAQLTSGVLSGTHLSDALRHAGAYGLRRRPNWQSHTAKPVRRPHTHTRTTSQRTAEVQERAAVQPRPCTGPVRAPPPRSPPVAPSTAALFMLACDRSLLGIPLYSIHATANPRTLKKKS